MSQVAFRICEYDEARSYTNNFYSVAGVITQYYNSKRKYADLMQLKGNKPIDEGRFGELMQNTDTVTCELNIDMDEIIVVRHDEVLLRRVEASKCVLDAIINKLIACGCV